MRRRILMRHPSDGTPYQQRETGIRAIGGSS